MRVSAHIVKISVQPITPCNQVESVLYNYYLNPDIRKWVLGSLALPVWPPVNQLPSYINTLWRCERLGRWEEINVFAFYTLWSGIQCCILTLVQCRISKVNVKSSHSAHKTKKPCPRHKLFLHGWIWIVYHDCCSWPKAVSVHRFNVIFQRSRSN